MLLVAVVPSLLFPPERPPVPQEPVPAADSGTRQPAADLPVDSEPAVVQTAPVAQDIQARATGFITERSDESKDGQKDENRIQLDVILSF